MKKTYTVLSPLNVDHTAHAVGDTVELDDQASLPLLAVNAIALIPAAPAKKAKE